MGLLNRIFRRSDSARPAGEGTGPHLAFVLLSEPQLPEAEEISRAFPAFGRTDERLQDGGERADSSAGQVISLKLNTGETVFVALMPVPVPDGEADQGAQYSLSSFRDGWTLPRHSAHLVVAMQGGEPSTLLTRVTRFTSILAAVVKSSPAVGVYWGSAGATHDSDFFASIAADQGVMPRITLWSGVSGARVSDGRLSLLSLGMNQLDLPDLLLIAGSSSESVALETMFDLLTYVVERGEALPEGDTVGRTAEEKLPVRYVRSPLNASEKVWRVELP